MPGSEFGPVLAYMRDHYPRPSPTGNSRGWVHMSVRDLRAQVPDYFPPDAAEIPEEAPVRMASRALVYTGQTLAEVAIGCGFSDQSHFTREFRRHFGRTPREYREHYAGTAAMTLLFQILPLTSKNGPAASRYSPAGPVGRIGRPRPFRWNKDNADDDEALA